MKNAAGPGPVSGMLFEAGMLRSAAPGQGSRNGRFLLVFGLLTALLMLAAVSLVAYLRKFEAEEVARSQSADALWLEETVRFHLRRLEGDLESLAKRAVDTRGASQKQQPPPAPGSSLRSYEGGLLAHAWQRAGDDIPAALAPRWTAARATALNAQSLDSMNDLARGLRRSAYAGPLEVGEPGGADEVWLSVPAFDRGEYIGSYIAVFSLKRTLELIVPAWFRKSHRVEVLDPANLRPTRAGQGLAEREQRFLASIDMPGSDTYLQVYAIDTPHATLPRALLAVALMFLTGMLGSLHLLRKDVERRQDVEKSLAAQVALRQSMEDSIDIGLFARDLSNVVFYANRAFCGIVGLQPDVLLGREGPFGWTAPPVLEQGKQEAEIELRRADGRTVQLMIHTVPLVHAKEGQIGWMTSVLDVSKRRRDEKAAQLQQQRLESAGRLVAIGEVASTLAHELNQPLGALSSFANGLLNRMSRGNIEPTQVRTIVERINVLAEKTGQIIRRVNAFARRREMQKERIDLSQFLRALQAVSATSPVRLELLLPDEPVIVRADAVLLEQALHNVMQNAAESAVATSQAPHVRMELVTSADDTHAAVSVSDNGQGIDDEARARIFDAFYSSKPDGMGMGLAICRSILEAHHGRIDLLADGALGGATFCLWLPVDRDGCNDTHRR